MATLPQVLQGKAINEAVKPLQWLMGKWKSTDGKGVFPNIAPFTYGEQIEFFSLGQPLLNYCSYSWHPERGAAMHLESGFLRIKPGTNQVAFMVAHNFGLTTLEEGEVSENKISLTSVQISRMSWAKDPEVTKIVRSWNLLENQTLEQVILMETKNTPLTEHLRVIYSKVD